jgi:hypothetical protein
MMMHSEQMAGCRREAVKRLMMNFQLAPTIYTRTANGILYFPLPSIDRFNELPRNSLYSCY